MAHAPSTSPLHPVTEEAFLADRMSFFSSFTSAPTGSVIFMVVLMVLMAIFLL